MSETGIIGIMKLMLRFLLTVISGIAGYQIAQLLMGMDVSWTKEISHPHIWSTFCVLLFALCGY
ncbi:MAG: twitching motility protein PilT, partial [Synergistaceae bacterium]|nr:twitching motility protein PilT [Synergistaceae bacterium]